MAVKYEDENWISTSGIPYKIIRENYNGTTIYRINLYSSAGPTSLNTGDFA